jgi:hypothetical protein
MAEAGRAPGRPGEALACLWRRLPAAAARLCAESFAAQPALADDLNRPHRYNAACWAAQAGCGQGEDDPRPDALERARLRTQAREWLAANLRALTALVERNNPQVTATVVQRLRHWQQDGDLSGVRHPWALWRLPDSERAAWRQLWADVAVLLQNAEGHK